MTQRKPSGMSFETWVDQQITQAQARGEFDGLAGAGKPLPKWSPDDGAYEWVVAKARKENLDLLGMLPPGLALRKEREDLPRRAAALPSEARSAPWARTSTSGCRRSGAGRRRAGGRRVPGLTDVDELVGRAGRAHASRSGAGGRGRSAARPGPATVVAARRLAACRDGPGRTRSRGRRPAPGPAGPSLASTWATWLLTVVSESTRSAAISALERPRASAVNTSSSRGVSRRSGSGTPAPGGGRRTHSSISRRVSAGSSRAEPSATVRTACSSAARGESLSRKPLAPARIAA